MFDVSSGEIAILASVGLILIGRKDLPIASRALGHQVGRIVGLLQGARLRADRFATDHQLKALQNEFRSGLRELDAVKAELAGSMMPGNNRVGMGGMGGMGGVGGSSSSMGGGNGNLGAMVSGVDRKKKKEVVDNTSNGIMSGSIAGGNNDIATSSSSSIASSMGADYLAAAQQAESAHGMHSPSMPGMNMDNGNNNGGNATRLAPRSRSVAAVAEEEWEKRGIGFRSIAEGGGRQQQQLSDSNSNSSAPVGGGVGGAVILSNYLRQSLIYDQYDRTVREQDEALKSRVDKVRNERSHGKSE
mmetsp:Transcript_14213/g.30362  ORF Transcript_14213/g.30362 Transcript_14213/m.30362 type:complete len:302 (-) Transcript_14213:150-1055(-)